MKTPPTKNYTFLQICKTHIHTIPVTEFRFHPRRRWRFDYALPKYKIAIEVEGGVWIAGRHTRPKGFLADIEKYNTATAMGWSVLRVTPQELCTSNTLQMIKQTIISQQLKNMP